MLRWVGAAHGSELYEGAQRLREVVLRKPLGLTLSEAELADDLSRQHFCAVERDVVVGAVSLKLPRGRDRATQADGRG